MREAGLKIHVAPNLIGYASSLQLDVKGAIRKKIVIDVHHEHGPSCNH